MLQATPVRPRYFWFEPFNFSWQPVPLELTPTAQQGEAVIFILTFVSLGFTPAPGSAAETPTNHYFRILSLLAC